MSTATRSILTGDETDLTCGERVKFFFKHHWRGMVIFLVPLVLLPMLFMQPKLPNYCLYLVLVMIIYYITICIPIYVTAMLPIIFLPWLGITSTGPVVVGYFSDATMFFFAAAMVALAVEYCNLSKRIAYVIILLVGAGAKRILFSLIFMAMFMSMWMSNTAVTAMMCPIIKAILEELNAQGITKAYDESEPADPPYPSKIAVCYYLGAAYAATIGGCGTLIGTGTNIAFKGMFDERFPDSPSDTVFLKFMLYNMPAMLLHTIFLFFWMQSLYMGLLKPSSDASAQANMGDAGKESAKKVVEQKRMDLGPMSMHEIQVLILFVAMIVLLITIRPGLGELQGWGDVMDEKDIRNSMPTMAVVILLFLLPANFMFMKYCICKKPNPETTTPSLVTWKFIHQQFPWGLLFLIGSAFPMATGVRTSGLGQRFAEGLSGAKNLPKPLLQFLVIVMAEFFTAFTVNMAACNMMMPFILDMSVSAMVHPLYLALPCTIGLSMAFMLPISTPPNAIVSNYANIKTKDMIMAGSGPTVVSFIVIFLTGQILAPLLIDEYAEFPDWADVYNFTTLTTLPPVTVAPTPTPAPP